MELHTNSSNNTIFADADGNIAYFHAQLHSEARSEVRLDQAGRRQRSGDRLARPAVGRRDAAPAESGERLALQHQQLAVVGGRPEQPEAGRLSRRTSRTAPRIAARRCTRIRVLPSKKDFTLDSLIAAAYDSYLPGSTKLIPPLLKAYDAAAGGDPLKAKLAEQIAVLRSWDLPLVG